MAKATITVDVANLPAVKAELTRLRDLVRDLAATEPTYTVDSENVALVACPLCGADTASFSHPQPLTLTDHSSECPWRRAIEYTEDNQ